MDDAACGDHETREAERRDQRLQSLCVLSGSVPTKERQATISTRLLEEEEASRFATEGLFAKRIRHLTDGVVIGSTEYVQRQLDHLREAGQYLRRRNPIPHLDGMHAALRPQRGAA